jgi:hypothetical protein
MNLPGPNQRFDARGQGQGDSASVAVVFRSRPLFVNASPRQKGAVRRVEERAQRGGQWLRHTPAWHASVWDEVRASANGALLRRIRILITDGPQLDSEEPAWG